MPPHFTLGNGQRQFAHSAIKSSKRDIEQRVLDARRPPGPGTAALGGCACRSRAVKPDHAPTSKGWEHDLLPCAVPGRTRGYCFENANLSRLQCDLQTLVISNVNVTRPDWPTSTAGDADNVFQGRGACIRCRAGQDQIGMEQTFRFKSGRIDAKSCQSGQTPLKFLSVAKSTPALFPELDVRTHPLLLVVGAKTDAIAISPTFIATLARAPMTPTGPVRWGVTFGKDSYTNNHMNLCHEVCHTLGLPDLYNFEPLRFTTGSWDVMGDIFRGRSLIGWHRHKLGWLADERKAYLAHGDFETVLTPLPGSTGTSMIVVPTDDALNPSKVYVLELAQPIRGHDGTTTGDGVLVYSVDARISTGHSPVRIVPAKTTTNFNYGELFEAPFSSRSTLDDPALPFSLSIKAKRDDGYVVGLKVR